MLITCPNCLTSYNIPPVPEDTGKKVKCAKCGRVWEVFNAPPPEDSNGFVEESISDDDTFFTENEENTEKDADIPLAAFQDFLKQPEKKPPAFLKWIKPLYFISLFCIAASVYLFFFRSPVHAPVTLQTIAVETVQDEYKTHIVLSAVAFNNTDKDIVPETFSIRFLDKDGHLLTTSTAASPISFLQARSTEEIRLPVERPPALTAKAVVTLTEFQIP